MPSRFYLGETTSKGLEREEVVWLLAATAGGRPPDVRDCAVLMLLISYGLHSGEVAGLQMDTVLLASPYGPASRVKRRK